MALADNGQGVKLPVVLYPVICGECGEMLYSPWRRDYELLYLHSTAEERRRGGNLSECPNSGKKFRIPSKIMELEEVE